MEYNDNPRLEGDSRSLPHPRPNSDASNSALLSSNAKRKACDGCKRRKIRCSGSIPCDHCQRTEARCQFTSSRTRMSVIESRYAQSQRRVQLLERAWHEFVPNIDLTYALHAISNATTEPGNGQSRAFNSISTPDAPNQPEQISMRSRPEDTPSQLSSPGEYELEKADSLEWDETSDIETIADGIGSLSVDPKGSGYMGPQSGNALIRYLQSIASFFPALDSSDPLYVAAVSPNRVAPINQSGSHAFTQRCVDWYFQYYHPAYPILHEGFFRAEFMGAIPKPKDGSWPILLNVVAAIGAFAGPESSKNADTHFFNIACENLSVGVLRRGSLPLVQAFALLANYVQKRGKPNTGFTFLGIAYNMALGIGLHREFSRQSMSAFSMEIRRRVWWTLYIFDSGSRLTFGRPSMILGGINIQAARNLHDHDLSVDIDELSPSRDEPTIVSSLIWQSKLAEISNLANAELLKRNVPDEGLVLSLDDRIKSWRDSLPAYFHHSTLESTSPWFEVPRMVLLWRSWHLRIVVTRPFLLDIVKNRKPLNVDNSNEAVGRCITSTQECVLSITQFCSVCDTFSGALVWYATYWLITAVFINVTCLVYDPNHSLGPVWRQQVESAKLVLKRISSIEPLAERAALILEKVMDLVPQSPDSAVFASNEPTRMGIADIWSQSWSEPLLPDNCYQSLEQINAEANMAVERVPPMFWET